MMPMRVKDSIHYIIIYKFSVLLYFLLLPFPFCKARVSRIRLSCRMIAQSTKWNIVHFMQHQEILGVRCARSKMLFSSMMRVTNV